MLQLMQCLLLLLSMLVGHWLIAALCCVHLATPVCALLLVLLRKYLLNVYTLHPIAVYNEQCTDIRDGHLTLVA
jgi:hypothetical protein